MNNNVVSTVNKPYALDVIRKYLPGYVNKRDGALTLEERTAVEGELYQFINAVLYPNSMASLVKAGQGLSSDLDTFIESKYRLLYELNLSALDQLSNLYTEYDAEYKTQLVGILNQYKRIKQKLAVYNLWQTGSKFLLSEAFSTYENISSQFLSTKELLVDVDASIALLPIASTTSIVPVLTILSDSNGVAGNSDIDVTTSNISLDNVLNTDSNNWFEYERLDNGPIVLKLSIAFSKPTIINHLLMEMIDQHPGQDLFIREMKFTTPNGTVDIEDLVGPKDETYWHFESLSADNSWSIYFLPVQASGITLTLESTTNSVIRVKKNNNIYSRKRWSIAIRRLVVNQHIYDGIGSIGSELLSLGTSFYALNPVVDIWPYNNALYNLDIETSVNNGENWNRIEADINGDVTQLLTGEETGFRYRAKISRLDSAFSNVSSYTGDVTPLELESSSTSISNAISPFSFSIQGKPKPDTLKVIQHKVGRRQDEISTQLVSLGKSSEDVGEYPIPFDLQKGYVTPEDLFVSVGRRPYTLADDYSNPDPGEFGLSTDYKVLLVNAEVAGEDVYLYVKSERVKLIEEDDGYLHVMDYLFDPDKNTLDVYRLPRGGKQKSIVLPKDKTTILLGYKNIVPDSESLVSSTGETYVDRNARELLGLEGDYYLDHKNGILYLFSPIGDSDTKISFKHQTIQKLNPSDYEIVFRDSLPYGIKLLRRGIEVESNAETSTTLVSRLNVQTGNYETRVNPFGSSTTKRMLSKDGVVIGTVKLGTDFFTSGLTPVEVEYIDGVSEFYGLTEIEDEYTNQIIAGGTGIVTFNLAAGANWYETLGITFSDTSVFSTVDATPSIEGEYTVSSAGAVSVYVGPGGTLPKGIQLNYYYKDPEYDSTDKYSVDYYEGIIYTRSEQNPDALIKYQTGNYKIYYNIAKELTDFTYDSQSNVVKLNTSGMSAVNGLVKTFWSKNTIGEFGRLSRYFSPLLNQIGFRFQ